MTQRKLLNPEYAESQARMNVLRNLVIDGRDAEAVMKYANILVDHYKEQLLDKALKNQDTSEAALEYRVASQLMDMLRHSAEIGKNKEEVLQRRRN